MRTLLVVGTALALLAANVVRMAQADSKPGPAFAFTDGYFQAVGGEPVHLTHDGVKLNIDRGREFQFWVTFHTSKVQPSPCSKSEKEPCYFRYQIVQRDAKGTETFLAGWKKGIDEHFDAGVTWSIGSDVQKAGRTLPPGPAFLVFKIVKNDKEVFRREFPLEIE